MIPGIASWVPYLSSQVGHVPFTTQDDYGVAITAGGTVWYPAHIEDAIAETRGGAVQTVSGRLHIIIGAVVRIDPRDRLIVQAPFTSRGSTGAYSTGEDAQMVRVSPSMAPFIGQHHTEVWVE